MTSTFQELFESSLQNIKEGEVVPGKIVAINGREVVIDIHYKSEGVLDVEEFSDPTEIVLGNDVNVLFEGFNDETAKTAPSFWSPTSPSARPTASAPGQTF